MTSSTVCQHTKKLCVVLTTDEEQDEDEAPVVAVSDELATAKTEKKDENVSEAQPALNVEENTEHEEANGTPEQTPDEVEATRERDKNSTEAEDLDEEETDPFADADDNDEFFKPAQPVDAEEEEADDDEEEQKEEAWEEVHAELQETEGLSCEQCTVGSFACSFARC